MEGEDLIVYDKLKNIDNGFYVDAGCYHPLHINNTFLLYKKGWRGINIDLSDYTIDLFNYIRPNDLNINSGIANYDGKIKFYFQKKLSQLTSVKKEIALKRMQGKIREKEIDARKLDTIINNTKFKNKKIDFLNIDIEGNDYEALQSLNFSIYRPKMICIEIDENNILNSNIYKYLLDLNYLKIWSSKSNLSHIFIENKI
jgi:FkbM family methyltransferase